MADLRKWYLVTNGDGYVCLEKAYSEAGAIELAEKTRGYRDATARPYIEENHADPESFGLDTIEKYLDEHKSDAPPTR